MVISPFTNVREYTHANILLLLKCISLELRTILQMLQNTQTLTHTSTNNNVSFSIADTHKQTENSDTTIWHRLALSSIHLYERIVVALAYIRIICNDTKPATKWFCRFVCCTLYSCKRRTQPEQYQDALCSKYSLTCSAIIPWRTYVCYNKISADKTKTHSTICF